MLKIQYISDLHNDYLNYYNKSIDYNTFPVVGDVLVIAGDFHSKKRGATELNILSEKFEKIFFVPGNHDYWENDFDKFKFKEPLNDNIHILDTDCIEYKGILFAGCTLWTDFKNNDTFLKYQAKTLMNDYKHMRRNNYKTKVSPDDIYITHIKHLEYLKIVKDIAETKKLELVIITHHAPSYMSVNPYFEGQISNAYYCSDLDYFVDSCACTWIHGHIHYAQDYEIGDTRVLCNPSGYSHEKELGIEPKFFELKTIDTM